jgi:hypothetical protein
MMTDFFKHHRNRDLYFNLTDAGDMSKFISACPPGTVSLTDLKESPADNIYKLNERVLIKDYMYKTD